jgi:peroxiredoxin
VFITLTALALALTAEAVTRAEEMIGPGESAPSFTCTDALTGTMMSFDSLYRDQPMVLVFLQTACRSCQREMDLLKKLHKEFGKFGVLGVFIDMTPRNFRKYIEQNELPFSFTWDTDNSIADAYGVSFSPASFLLDQNRKVVRVYRGFHPGMQRTMRTDLEMLTAGL